MEHGNIQGYIQLTHPDLNQSATLNFFQNYTSDPIDPVLGDINGDGSVDILDIVGAVWCILYEIDVYAENDFNPLGDYDQDGVVTI